MVAEQVGFTITVTDGKGVGVTVVTPNAPIKYPIPIRSNITTRIPITSTKVLSFFIMPYRPIRKNLVRYYRSFINFVRIK